MLTRSGRMSVSRINKATPLLVRTATGRAVFMREVIAMNVPEMTVGKTEQEKEVDKLKAEIKELRSQLREQELELNRHIACEEKAYMRGRIEGLEFAIRCNGISGDEVKK